MNPLYKSSLLQTGVIIVSGQYEERDLNMMEKENLEISREWKHSLLNQSIDEFPLI